MSASSQCLLEKRHGVARETELDQLLGRWRKVFDAGACLIMPA